MTAPSHASLAREFLAAHERLLRLESGNPAVGRLARLIKRAGARLSKPPRVALLGEFNAGKSTIANALIGTGVVPTSIHANTRVLLRIHYADAPSLELEGVDRVRQPISQTAFDVLRQGGGRLLHLGLPVERLKTLEIIDTPGLAAGSPRAEEMCLEAARRAHVAIWCTSATQAWKASEQATWGRMPARLRPRSILAVTRKDMIMEERSRERMLARIGAEARDRFRGIALISALDAAEARGSSEHRGDARLWAESGGAELEARVLECVAEEVSARLSSAAKLLGRTTARLAAPAGGRAGAGAGAAGRPVV